jgi:hypothetical protein
VISSAGQPEEQPDLKKPTALRGVVGVWDRESDVERSHFPALLTFAQRARCAAAILLRPAALIVLRLPRFADTPPTP